MIQEFKAVVFEREREREREGERERERERGVVISRYASTKRAYVTSNKSGFKFRCGEQLFEYLETNSQFQV